MTAATAKDRLPQPIGLSSELPRISAVFLEASIQTRTLALDELVQLSRIMPLVVLVPKSFGQGQSVPNQIASRLANRNSVGKTEPLRLLPKSSPDQPQSASGMSESVFGDVRINFPEMVAYRKDEPVKLNNLEFKLLKYFIQNPRIAISRDQLLNQVWGYENYPCTRTVDNHILKLRQKFERDPSKPEHFLTVHGTGYKFRP
jgi:DNA-binding response OmpR family regulator